MKSPRSLEVRDLTAGYDHANVIEGVSIDVKQGAVTAILGANGAGKSTLIRTISGLLPARRGSVRYGTFNCNDSSPHRISAEGIAVVLEGNRVFPKMSVLENLQVGSLSLPDHSTRARLLREQFAFFPRLRERRSQLAGTLSGGERSMLAIARALMSDPHLVVFDEPSLGLSPLFVTEVFRIVKSLREIGKTVLLVEQNVRQTLKVADYGYVLAKGRISAQGNAQELINDSEVARAYFGADQVDR